MTVEFNLYSTKTTVDNTYTVHYAKDDKEGLESFLRRNFLPTNSATLDSLNDYKTQISQDVERMKNTSEIRQYLDEVDENGSNFIKWSMSSLGLCMFSFAGCGAYKGLKLKSERKRLGLEQ